ncbi:MAG: hypothetical protein IKD14_04180 [Clostridia bacterium]|nr:hypothetical protein [Clostridia bacterium]
MDDKRIVDLLQKNTDLSPQKGAKERILSMAQREPFPDENTSKSRNNRLIGSLFVKIAAPCACLILMLSLIFTITGTTNKAYAEYYVDVNPSVVLTVNKRDKVIDVSFLNEDGKSLLDGLELEGEKIDDAVKAIVKQLKEESYLEENHVLAISGFSLKSKDLTDKINALTDTLQQYATELGENLELYDKTLSKSDWERAKDRGMSPVKLDFVEQVLSLDDSYRFEAVKEMTVTELTQIISDVISTLDEELLALAQKENLSPVRYALITDVLELTDDYSKEELSLLSTAELKTLYYALTTGWTMKPTLEELFAATELGISPDAYRTINKIIALDDTYALEELVDKSELELRSIYFRLRHTLGNKEDDAEEPSPEKLFIIESLLALDPTLDEDELKLKSVAHLTCLYLKLLIAN